ncbi:MAG: DNA repair protein RecO [Treponema sp.]|jgi:DNA repair protein RecO (recombination protein O)|nr:DNA repair protein RecO [Treponema sp.]
MLRTERYSALILRSRPSGEANRDVWLLSAEAGILRATVFGGPKSRLRAHTAPFHSGQVWIYHDPVKDSRKLNDFDVRSWRPGLRELYERTMAAGAMAETILASHGGGGNWAGALALAEAILDTLESAGEETCLRILLYFFWQWAGFLGLQPDLNRCASCGNMLASGSPVWYSPQDSGMLCAACSGEYDRALLPVNPGCRHWLETISRLAPRQLDRYTMDSKSSREARSFTTAILTEVLGKRLASWDW